VKGQKYNRDLVPASCFCAKCLLHFDGLTKHKIRLHYSAEAGILNRPKSSLFGILNALSDEKGLLASPTGFEPVLPP
jgi:hypothetical protein